MKNIQTFEMFQKLNENTLKYISGEWKSILTNREMLDFIEDNDLRDVGGKMNYNSAKDIVYRSDTKIWTLQKLSLLDLNKKGLDYLCDKKPKTLGIPVILLHCKFDDTYEILDGRHRIGYTRYKKLPEILAYITEVENLY